jgi:uncharacterized membrane protein
MGFLIAGVILWSAAHFFKRLAPAARAGLGDKGRLLVTAALGASLLMMIFGYRMADFIPVYTPPEWARGVNNLVMIAAFYVFGASAAKPAKVWLGTKLRHPQLAAVAIWAVAHLLVNGDAASLVLFGGLLAWAFGAMALINRAEGTWDVPAQASVKKEITLIVITVVLYSIVAAIHIWLGVNPFV